MTIEWQFFGIALVFFAGLLLGFAAGHPSPDSVLAKADRLPVEACR